LIKENGCKAGLVLNPATPMSVNPGFGGQQFIPSVLPKIEAVRKRIDALGKPVWLEVDGGIKADNIASVARAGADTFVAGSAIFGAKDGYAAAIAGMRAQLAKVV
jgi:ribulose-phosphate 3-epimerase